MELSRRRPRRLPHAGLAPAGPGWLAALLGGFALADDVALVCGPYLPRPDASPMVRRELLEYFARFGGARVDRGAAAPGPATFFSSANGAVARWAWERVPFRPVAVRRGPAARARHARRRPREGVRAGGGGRALARPPAAARAAPLLRRLPRAGGGARASRADDAALHRRARARRRRGRPRVHAPRGARGADAAARSAATTSRARSAAASARTPTGCRAGRGAAARA